MVKRKRKLPPMRNSILHDGIFSSEIRNFKKSGFYPGMASESSDGSFGLKFRHFFRPQQENRNIFKNFEKKSNFSFLAYWRFVQKYILWYYYCCVFPQRWSPFKAWLGTRLGLVWRGQAGRGEAWQGQERGSAWLGLVWRGLAWRGLDWRGLARQGHGKARALWAACKSS